MKKIFLTCKNVIEGKSQFNNDFKYTALLYTVLMVHVMFLLFFLFAGYLPLIIYNSISILFYILLSLWQKNGIFALPFMPAFIEVLLSSCLSTILIGWDGGFYLYIITLFPIIFYAVFTVPDFKRKFLLPTIVSIVCMISFLGIKIYTAHYGSLSSIDSPHFMGVLYTYNTIVAFLIIILYSVMFTLDIQSNQRGLERKNKELDYFASIDPLTQLLNRRCMEHKLLQSISQASSNNSVFCVIMCDIDDFKVINDSYGHKYGDYVLMDISRIIRTYMREEDAVCRWGGEEILIMLITSEPYAVTVAERIRKAIEESVIRCPAGYIRYTVTMGISQYVSGDTPDSLIQHADDYLYKGKREGKNKVVSSLGL